MDAAKTPPVTPQPAAQALAAPDGPKMTKVDIPIEVPDTMLRPDAGGRMPIDDYQVQLLPKDAIITNQSEVKKLVEQVREETLPAGMKVELADSPGGLKAAKGKQVLAQLAQMGGSMGVYTLTGVQGTLGALAFVPASVAAPLATVGGAAGLFLGMDQIKQGLDAKHYYEGLKGKGIESIPIQQAVRNADGTQGVGVRQVPIDDIISGARDGAIVGGLQTGAAAAMLAAGLGAPPLLAVASVALSLGTLVFATRKIVAALAGKVAGWVKSKFSGEEKTDKPAPADPKQAAPVQAAAPANGPAPAAKAAAAPKLDPDQQKAVELATRIQQIQGELASIPEAANKLAEAQTLQQQVFANPKGDHSGAQKRLQQIDGELLADPKTAPLMQELQTLQAELMNNAAFQQEMAAAFSAGPEAKA